MKKVCTKDEFNVLEFKPSVFKLMYDNMDKMSIQRRIRFLIEYMRGYKVYYLETKGVLVAYSIVSKGGGRYVFASNDDIVVGPYFVKEKYRGRGYSEILVSTILEICDFNYAYDWIHKNNTPSLKCSRRVGFEVINTANIISIFRFIKVCNNNNGDYFILRYKKAPRSLI